MIVGITFGQVFGIFTAGVVVGAVGACVVIAKANKDDKDA